MSTRSPYERNVVFPAVALRQTAEQASSARLGEPSVNTPNIPALVNANARSSTDG
jgi:hypothetical protein